jgi:CheY-like chemotaxis protein
MTDLLRRSLGESIEIEAVVAGGLWNAMVDASQLETAVLNLAINARDAMPEGGKLTIELSNASLDDGYAAENPQAMPGQYVLLAVTDTGTGMTPAVMARCFDPFFTTKPEGIGTGLGLSMVYGFIKQSGGHVKLYSEPGHGTSAKLYLPRARQAEEKPRQSSEQIVGGAERVLVVEDDAVVRLTAVEMLESLGYQVLTAENGERAIALLGSGVSIDLLFTDVVMPGAISGRELARQAMELRPGLRVLFTSGYTENAIIHHGRVDPDVHLLSKPYRTEELARKVRLVLEKEKVRS